MEADFTLTQDILRVEQDMICIIPFYIFTIKALCRCQSHKLAWGYKIKWGSAFEKLA